jgi:hypothetical protein
MALTNAQKQERWRRRNQVVLTDSAEEITERLMAMDEAKLRKVFALINSRLKDTPCENCNGTGVYRLRATKEGSCTNKKGCVVTVTDHFPCPNCRPVEYSAASGIELRNQGRYAEAVLAALDVMDLWAAGDTLMAWGVSPKEAQAAIRESGRRVAQTDLVRMRDTAGAVPTGKRKHSLHVHMGLLGIG